MKTGILVGKEVVGSNGWKIGKIRDVTFNEKTWQIGSLDIQLERSVAEEYQMKALLTRPTLSVDVSSVHAVGDHVILSVTKPELREMVTTQMTPSPSTLLSPPPEE
ncbi:MAG: PRC-barrel domain-containing protein [Thermoplasmata archaeon]